MKSHAIFTWHAIVSKVNILNGVISLNINVMLGVSRLRIGKPDLDISRRSRQKQALFWLRLNLVTRALCA